MFQIKFLSAIAFALLFVSIQGFAPRQNAFQPASQIKGVSPVVPMKIAAAATILRMAEDGEMTTKKSKIAADGTFYDDEVDSAPKKEGLSDSMKQRLMREASAGLDSNQKQTNVILYISAAVVVLILLGGSGILY